MDSFRPKGTVSTKRGQLQKDVGGAAQSYYLWDGANLVAQLSSSATTVVTEYSYYPGVDRPHAIIVGGQQYNAHVDGMSNVIALTDGAQTLKRTYDFDAWGTNSGGSDLGGFTGTDRARFKGAMWLGPELDVYYMRARWYEPKSGRFLSEDPIGLQGGINPYVFAGSDPVNGRDPTGLDCYYIVRIWYEIETGKIVDVEILGSYCDDGPGGGGVGNGQPSQDPNKPQQQPQKPAACPAGPTQWPAGGPDQFPVTSPFGADTPGRRRIRGASVPHRGIDQATPIGTPIHPMAPGVVAKAESTRANGNYVSLSHGNGFVSFYLHMSESSVAPGDTVGLSDLIGLSGESGLASGPSLHFQLNKNGVPVDPRPCLP